MQRTIQERLNEDGKALIDALKRGLDVDYRFYILAILCHRIEGPAEHVQRETLAYLRSLEPENEKSKKKIAELLSTLEDPKEFAWVGAEMQEGIFTFSEIPKRYDLHLTCGDELRTSAELWNDRGHCLYINSKGNIFTFILCFKDWIETHRMTEVRIDDTAYAVTTVENGIAINAEGTGGCMDTFLRKGRLTVTLQKI